MKNTCRSLARSHWEEAVRNNSKDLRRGGFSKEMIGFALEAARVGYTRMVENEVKGISMINRPEHKGRKGRMVTLFQAKSTWFKKIGDKNSPNIPNGLRIPRKTRLPPKGKDAGGRFPPKVFYSSPTHPIED